MMPGKLSPKSIPDTILILGTDASGKDHVANLLIRMIVEAGGAAEKRARYFSGSATREVDSSAKGWWDTAQATIFLMVFRSLGLLMPLVVTVILRWDIFRYRPPAAKKLVVVGHNGLRALAFHYGVSGSAPKNILLPRYLIAALHQLRERTRVQVIVLDVADQVRQQRLAARLADGSEDTFDQYMRRNSRRSERIEAALVHLAVNGLGGWLIENNDLPEHELRRQLLYGCGAKAGRSSVPPQ